MYSALSKDLNGKTTVGTVIANMHTSTKTFHAAGSIARREASTKTYVLEVFWEGNNLIILK